MLWPGPLLPEADLTQSPIVAIFQQCASLGSVASKGRHQKSDIAKALDDAKAAGMTVLFDKNGHRWGYVICAPCGQRFKVWGTPKSPSDHAKDICRFVSARRLPGVTMTKWEFTAVLNRRATDEETDALYDAGMDDCSCVDAGVGKSTYLYCHRAAATFWDAVSDVARRVRTVPGLRVDGIEDNDAVTLNEASSRLGTRSAESLRQLALGLRGPGNFPAPLASSGKVSLYSFAAIVGYLRDTLRDDLPDLPNLTLAREYALANAVLRARSLAEETGHLAEAAALLQAA